MDAQTKLDGKDFDKCFSQQDMENALKLLTLLISKERKAPEAHEEMEKNMGKEIECFSTIRNQEQNVNSENHGAPLLDGKEFLQSPFHANNALLMSSLKEMEKSGAIVLKDINKALGFFNEENIKEIFKNISGSSSLVEKTKMEELIHGGHDKKRGKEHEDELFCTLDKDQRSPFICTAKEEREKTIQKGVCPNMKNFR